MLLTFCEKTRNIPVTQLFHFNNATLFSELVSLGRWNQVQTESGHKYQIFQTLSTEEEPIQSTHNIELFLSDSLYKLSF